MTLLDWSEVGSSNGNPTQRYRCVQLLQARRVVGVRGVVTLDALETSHRRLRGAEPRGSRELDWSCTCGVETRVVLARGTGAKREDRKGCAVRTVRSAMCPCRHRTALRWVKCVGRVRTSCIPADHDIE